MFSFLVQLKAGSVLRVRKKKAIHFYILSSTKWPWGPICCPDFIVLSSLELGNMLAGVLCPTYRQHFAEFKTTLALIRLVISLLLNSPVVRVGWDRAGSFDMEHLLLLQGHRCSLRCLVPRPHPVLIK